MSGKEELRLSHQICFPLYAASRLMMRLYQEHLEPLGLTYPQYIVMMILWEHAPCRVSDIGEKALLQSNTLTPLLKRLETQGLVQRTRSQGDERVVTIALTPLGRKLEEQAICIPKDALKILGFEPKKARLLKQDLDELLEILKSRIQA